MRGWRGIVEARREGKDVRMTCTNQKAMTWGGTEGCVYTCTLISVVRYIHVLVSITLVYAVLSGIYKLSKVVH